MRDSSRGEGYNRTHHNTHTHTHTHGAGQCHKSNATRAMPQEQCEAVVAIARSSLDMPLLIARFSPMSRRGSSLRLGRWAGMGGGREAGAATRGGDQGRRPGAGAGGLGAGRAAAVGLQQHVVCARAHVSVSGEMDGGVARRGACARHAVSKTLLYIRRHNVPPAPRA